MFNIKWATTLNILSCVLILLADHIRADPNYEQIQIIERSLNKHYDPCDNFYGYACSNWATYYATENYSEILQLVDYNYNQKLKHLLQTESEHVHRSRETGQSALDKMQIFYKSCEQRDSRSLLDYFDVIRPGNGLEWPALQVLRSPNCIKPQWLADRFDIFQILGEMQIYDFDNVIMRQGMYRAPNGTLEIYLHLPDMSDVEPLSFQDVVNYLIFVGMPAETAVEYAPNIIDTEEFWLKTYERFEDLENEATFIYHELKNTYPQLATYIEALIPQQMQDDDAIYITNLDYYEFLMGNQLNDTESEQLANYLWLKFLIYGASDAEDDCLKDLRYRMDQAVNYMYYHHNYLPHSERTNNQIQTISDNILKHFLAILDENHLNLQHEQLHKLKDKISHVKINVGNLPKNISVEKLDEIYHDVTALDVNSYFHNQLKLLKHVAYRRLYGYHHLTYSLEDSTSMGYDFDVNMLSIPFAYLEAPMFDVDYDPLFKWSLFGFLFSHEFSHALGIDGLLMDNQGLETDNFKDILEDASFVTQSDCIDKQSKSDNLAERIADNIGLRVAYRAFTHEHAKNLQPEFTSHRWEKLFFLNLAQFYCGNEDADAKYLHQLVQNSNEFAIAFQCLADTRMNPSKKCRLY